jgi:hypothetical protein
MPASNGLVGEYLISFGFVFSKFYFHTLALILCMRLVSYHVMIFGIHIEVGLCYFILVSIKLISIDISNL